MSDTNGDVRAAAVAEHFQNLRTMMVRRDVVVDRSRQFERLHQYLCDVLAEKAELPILQVMLPDGDTVTVPVADMDKALAAGLVDVIRGYATEVMIRSWKAGLEVFTKGDTLWTQMVSLVGEGEGRTP